MSGLRPDQERAATCPTSVAVVAGAGTGKTHMLAHRYLHHLRQGLNPLQVVAATFTEKAAAELRARIRALIAEELTDRPEAQVEIEAAQIGTIHALAARICRDHPDAAGVPADFAVLDELEGSIWRAERLEEALATLPPSLFRDLPYQDVRAALIALVDDPVEAEAAFEVGPEQWPALVARIRQRALADVRGSDAWQAAVAVVRSSRGADGDKEEAHRAAAAEALARLDAVSHDVASADDLEALTQAFDVLSGLKVNVGSVRNWTEGNLAEVKDALRTLRESVKAARKDGRVELALGPVDVRLAGVLPELERAFRQVRAALAADKRRRRVLDFADLEAHALEALDEPAVREHYQARWSALLVDEFQDTNPVQEQLLERLAGGMTITVVGDEKQGIYGFRRADVEVFRRFRRRILDQGGQEVRMSESFRAHDDLTTCLNRVFAPVLADLHQDLEAYRRDAPHPGPHVTLHLLRGGPQRGQRLVAEARIVAERLRAMLDDGTPVHDKETGATRPVRPGDVAVLTRSWQPLAVYGEVLPAMGVPAVHSGGGNLLATREAKDAYALLRFLADPFDDLALVAVLRSPYFAVDDPTLYRFAQGMDWLPRPDQERRRRKFPPWWEALAAADTLPLPLIGPVRVLARILEARAEAAPSALLQLADRLTGYAAAISGLPGAERRLADLTGFVEIVRSLEDGLGDVFSVTRRLRRIDRAGVEVPRPLLRADDAVTLLTIHGSKGLEWPVVVVADLTRRANGMRGRHAFRRGLGVALRLQDDDGENEDPALFTILRAEQAERDEAEAKRLAYVALTRARDRLFLTASSERAGLLDVIRPGLAAAGVDAEVVDYDPVLAEYPAPPPPSHDESRAEPALYPREIEAVVARAFADARPLGSSETAHRAGDVGTGPGETVDRAAEDWEMAAFLVETIDPAWADLVSGLRQAGAPPPSLDLVGSELLVRGRLTDHQVILGWEGDDGAAVVDAATVGAATVLAATVSATSGASSGRLLVLATGVPDEVADAARDEARGRDGGTQVLTVDPTDPAAVDTVLTALGAPGGGAR
ncbi:MAG: UvrD-helicase domain-containing protein [Trueperaceae bacterium]